jgi:hypothetical protein
LNLKAVMQFFCKQINYIACQISEKDHILLIIQIQMSGFAVVCLNHEPFGKRLFLSIIVYKKLHESFQIQITRKFHASVKF